MGIRKQYCVYSIFALLTSAPCVAAEPPDSEIRTFEFLTYRVSVLSTDDEALLFDWTAEQYTAELREQEAQAEGGSNPKIGWIASYDGLVWGRSDTQLAAQWNGPSGKEDGAWTFFHNENRAEEGFKFPATSRLMGMTDRFVWHGWPRTVLEFYLPAHRENAPHIWIELALAQQMFLACAAPEEAFEKYACLGQKGTFLQASETLSDGRVRRESTFKRDGLLFEAMMRADTAGPDPVRKPARWRFVQKNLQAGTSLVFLAEWRETTSASDRILPTLPKDVPQVHSDVDRINSVGVQDRTGLGLWGDRPVDYLKVTAGMAASNWLSSSTGRFATNISVFVFLLSLLWRERLSSITRGIKEIRP